MSVEVKTPTKSQFNIKGFPCGERLKDSNDSGNEDGVDPTLPNKDVKCANVSFQDKSPDKQSRYSFSKSEKPKEIQYRKRRYSMPQKLGDTSQGFNISFMKKRKFLMEAKAAGKKITLPTKFLLGGNINDPLNLNSLYHDEEGKVLNESTPVSSPMPTPSHRKNVEVVIPPNITDPLNLDNDDDTFMGRIAKKRKRSYRHKRKESTTHSTPIVKEVAGTEKKRELMEALKIDIDTSHEISDELSSGELTLDIQSANTIKSSYKIVSPVIPQASPKLRRRRKTISECNTSHDSSLETSRALFCTHSPEPKITPPKKTKRQFSNSRNNSLKTKSPVKFVKNPKFTYGNYNRYYGYRNPSAEHDHRMMSFDREWFECKDVLDIGCNVGHLTTAIARDFRPRKIIGMDIDASLIKMARKNIRHYVASHSTDITKFPGSSLINYGPLAAPPIAKDQETPPFPHNLMFMQGNIVLESDEVLEFQEEEYDLILALSITKWIHLNWGDEGLKRALKRIFKQLRPGGKLILEPQAWASYKKRKKLSESIFKNYESIKLKPEQFPNYLLSEVGFSKCEVIAVPYNKSKGFRRPLQLYTKADTVANTPFTDMDENSQANRPQILAPTLKSSASTPSADTATPEHVTETLKSSTSLPSTDIDTPEHVVESLKSSASAPSSDIATTDNVSETLKTRSPMVEAATPDLATETQKATPSGSLKTS